MSVSGIVQPAVYIPIAPAPTQAPKPFLQQVKEKIIRIWNAIVLAIQSVGQKTHLGAFLVLEWVHSGWGWKYAAVVQYIGNKIQSIQLALHMKELTLENETLRARVQLLDSTIQERDAISQDRAILLQENHRLQNELNAQRVQAQQGAVAKAQISHLQMQLDAVTDRQQLSDAFNDLLAKSKDIQLRPDAEKTELDDIMEKLIPQLLTHIETNRQFLSTSKEGLKGTAAEVAIDSTDWLIQQVVDLLNKIPPAFTRHKNWNNQLLVIQRQFAVIPEEVL